MKAMGSKIAALGLAAVAAGAAAMAMAGAVGAEPGKGPGPAEAAGDRLGATIESRLEAEGPWITEEDQAVIDRKCGYAPGESDRHGISISNGVLLCSNGRKVDDAETRALLAIVQPRIERRVKRVMESAEVEAAIAVASSQAAAEALRGVDHGQIAREAVRSAQAALREARREKE